MMLALSGPLFLLFYKILYNALKSQGGSSLQSESEYRVLLTERYVTLHSFREWKNLKEFSFFVTFSLCLSVSLLFLTLDSEEPVPETEPISGLEPEPEAEPEPKSEEKTKPLLEWNMGSMVRDGYRYRVERLPVSLLGKKRDYKVDPEGSISFSEIVLMKEGEEVFLKREYIRESVLISLLREVEREEGEDCVCPVFLGIRGNLSFIHYQEKEWIILFDPSISHHPKDAVIIKKRVHYSEQSRFNGFLQEPHRRDLYRQYDRFTVAFDSLSLGGGEQGLEVKRISLPLEGRDAICFTFCQNQQQEWDYPASLP